MLTGYEFNEKNKEKTFVKLTNKLCIHNNFEYKEGLNEDILLFDPYKKCGAGGLYFCEINYLHLWIEYCGIMEYVWNVTIPEDAKIKCNKFVIQNKQCIWDNYDLCLELIKQNGLNLKYIKEQTNKICLEAVKQNGHALQYVKEQTNELCLKAVKQNGYSLKYVKNQTDEICLEAVKQNGYALEYVKDQTNEICLEAVKQNGNVLQYVKEQTNEICLEAVKQNCDALEYVKNKQIIYV